MGLDKNRRMAGAQNWLIVTGAGASRNLGVEREMPLMGDWARALVDALNEVAVGFGQAVGLRADMAGEEFEEALGRFLAWSRSLPTTRTLLPLGFDNVVGDDDTQVRRWFDQGEARADRALVTVHRVLYELFGQNDVSSVSAREAYGKLLRLLGSGDQSLLAYATTNYDVAGEVGLDQLGLKPHWGETPSLVHDPVIDPEHVYDRIGRGTVPVLHLHGRVGWYFDEEGKLLSRDPRAPFSEHLGTPALLLPDPKKDYAQFTAVESLWRQLEVALGQADRTLVLGHSLNDSELIRALRTRPTTQIGVTVLHHEECGHEEAERAAGRVREQLPECHVIPMSFGPDLLVDEDALQAFVDGGSIQYPRPYGSR